jgi:hypothetical protein
LTAKGRFVGCGVYAKDVRRGYLRHHGLPQLVVRIGNQFFQMVALAARTELLTAFIDAPCNSTRSKNPLLIDRKLSLASAVDLEFALTQVS